jgi:hypothetical protein
MRDFEDSTLWRISEFERARQHAGALGYTGQRHTVFPSTLQAELDTLGRDPVKGDVLEVMAALRRHRESALVYLSYEKMVWPMTVFPSEMAYHSPRNVLETSERGLRSLKPLCVEPPGVLPPGHWESEKIAYTSRYRPLTPVLWAFAMQGPRTTLLSAIGGSAAYRTLREPKTVGLFASGAMGAALDRLTRGPVSHRELAAMPGMSVERAARLLNGLYLVSNLMVTRASPAARREPLLGLLRRLRI